MWANGLALPTLSAATSGPVNWNPVTFLLKFSATFASTDRRVKSASGDCCGRVTAKDLGWPMLAGGISEQFC